MIYFDNPEAHRVVAERDLLERRRIAAARRVRRRIRRRRAARS